MAMGTFALVRSKRILAQIRFKRRLPTRTHFFFFRMALERGKSTKDAVNKSCWWSMGWSINRALYSIRKCPVNNCSSIQTCLSRYNVLLLLQAFDAITLQRYTLYQCHWNQHQLGYLVLYITHFWQNRTYGPFLCKWSHISNCRDGVLADDKSAQHGDFPWHTYFDTASLALFVGFVSQYTIPTLNYIFIVSILLNTLPTFIG